ncbi:hypothetical protein DL93DRAFT_257069 [Clavulina sp. PMI_390]|nr:hypothetical protein DL93DRAFT_257069 [Clavulina sp. PMI_390]
MAMAVASVPHQFGLRDHASEAFTTPSTSPSPYEDQIVPALRRRLAQESQELSKRMSTHILDSAAPTAADFEPPPPLPPHASSSNDSHPNTTSHVGYSPNPRSANLPRQRTFSTPYPFDQSSPSRAASGSTPTKAARTPSSASKPPTPVGIPSRIPKPRSRASSSARGIPKLSPSPTPSPHLLPTTLESSTPPNEMHELQPLHAKPYQPRHSEAPTADHSSSLQTEMEPQFEHWYRGEGRSGGGRNGGRGEIQAGTQEMLAIALSGHRDSWSFSPQHDDEDDHEFQLPWNAGTLPHDLVTEERMLTDMEGDDKATEADTFGEPGSPVRTPPQLPISSPRNGSVREPPPIQREPQTPSKQKPSRPNPPNPKPRATPNKRATPRVRRKASFPPSTQQTSRSAYDLSAVPTFAGAIPQWDSQPTMPPSGDWDEVVLPTIAKKLKLAQEGESPDVTLLGSRSEVARTLEEPPPPPAPGTFAYSAPKTHLRAESSDQFRVLDTPLSDRDDDPPQPGPSPSPPPPIVAAPTPTPHVANIPKPSLPISPAVNRPQGLIDPNLQQAKPAIRVTSPSIKSHSRPEDDDHGGGCCRCVVM